MVRFILLFMAYAAVFSFVLEMDWTERHFFHPTLELIAGISGWILNLAGSGCTANGVIVSNGRFTIEIAKGCDSIYPTALLWSGMLAYPSRLGRKLPGLIVGAIFLFVLNIVRVVTLFYVGVNFPAIFDAVHLYAWQSLFVLVTVGFWLVWTTEAAGRAKMPHA